ncbi:TetR/AcrR family transcriptional regulator [Stappia sp. BW2]|uniref:TetR/AcrR family transcriptional regulator n=1 Tax=Stappia sp. BW2 TaxID=2592622 RepID=UPI0011DE928B|nr:TetR/AcrR family transcriptional regulator [Stappia sp. BW2]TYC78547.1 TetR/AcrR family transcriptional regulator [Stappia sp. BW2]
MTGRKPPRRTQAEKSAAMRLKLCEATLSALAEVGYEKTTTQEICARAGVSRGALTHQFPTRVDILSAAFEHLLEAWEAERRTHIASLPEGQPISFEAYTRHLWRVVFSSQNYVAALELMMAARMDGDLAANLRSVLARWRSVRDFLSLQLLGREDEAEDPQVLTFLHLNLCMLRGIAIHGSFDASEEERERLLDAWLEFLGSRADVMPGYSPEVLDRV